MFAKPLGLLGASALAVQLGVAVKLAAYTWRQLAGAGTLAGISFWVSLFTAGQASPVELGRGVAEGGGSGRGRMLGDASGGMPEIGVRFDERGWEVERWPLAQACDEASA
jgi:hypothetical protein